MAQHHDRFGSGQLGGKLKAPDDVVILTWDIAAEVVSSLRAAGLTRTRFVVPLPRLAEVD